MQNKDCLFADAADRSWPFLVADAEWVHGMHGELITIAQPNNSGRTQSLVDDNFQIFEGRGRAYRRAVALGAKGDL